MRSTPRKFVDAGQSTRYRMVAEQFLKTAQALRDLGDDAFANGIGIVSIHAAIAMCDAVTIRVGGCKSTSGEHEDAVRVLADVVSNVPDSAMRGLRDAIQSKNRYSYTGTLLRMDAALRILAGVEVFFDWARTRF